MEEMDAFSAKFTSGVEVEVAPERTAVILVDLVNDYLQPNGAMAVSRPEAMLSKAGELATHARAAGAKVVWVRPGHSEAEDGLFRKRIPHGFVDSWGAQLLDTLPVDPHDRVMTKRRYSAFFQTDLDMYLREHRIERVIVCGVALNICVRSTIHDAFFYGYDVWLARDASQATGPREEESSVFDIESHFGRVLNVAEIVERLAQ